MVNTVLEMSRWEDPSFGWREVRGLDTLVVWDSVDVDTNHAESVVHFGHLVRHLFLWDGGFSKERKDPLACCRTLRRLIKVEYVYINVRPSRHWEGDPDTFSCSFGQWFVVFYVLFECLKQVVLRCEPDAVRWFEVVILQLHNQFCIGGTRRNVKFIVQGINEPQLREKVGGCVIEDLRLIFE